jgi:hypothetical protein
LQEEGIGAGLVPAPLFFGAGERQRLSFAKRTQSDPFGRKKGMKE